MTFNRMTSNGLRNAIACAGLLAGAALSQGVHPGYSLFNLNGQFLPANQFYGNNPLPLVGGMDVFPDGRVAIVEWGVPASVYILTGLPGGNENIQVKRFARGLDNAMGLKIVDNVIYVMEREGLTQLLDTDGDGEADQYNSINQSFPSNTSMLNLSYDLGYRDGAFWVATSADVAQGGYSWGSSQKPTPTALPNRNTMYKLNLDGSSEAWASGFRNPNGMAVNGQDLFVSDNEGSWTPSSKVIHVKQGRFYGHRSNPVGTIQAAANNVQSPPVIWSNWESGSGFTPAHSTGRSFGNPIVLKRGPYAGQMLVPDFPPDYAQNRIIRVFVEKINGELQGVIFPFVKGGTSTGPHRIKEMEDGSLVIGMIGSNCCWGSRSGMTKGFNVMRPATPATPQFEIKAIRSMGPQNFEIEFNRPAVDAGVTTKYSMRTWRHNAIENYGGGRNQNVATLTVNAATVSSDGLKVNLQVTGLPDANALAAEGGTRLVKFAFNGITAGSATTDTLWTHFAVYTLNQYGPGTDYQAVSIAPSRPRGTESGWKVTRGTGYHNVEFFWNDQSPRQIAVYDTKGAKRLEVRGAKGPSVRLETAGLAKGLYVIRVTSGIAGTPKATAQPLIIQ
jgi:hypothetical protein